MLASYCFFTSAGVDRGLRSERIRRQHHVFDLRLLGRLERRRVLVVEGLDLGLVDLDVLDERLGIDHGDGDLALLLEQPQVSLGGRSRDDVGRGDRLLHGGR